MVITILGDGTALALSRSFKNITLHISLSTKALIKGGIFLDPIIGEYPETPSFPRICIMGQSD